MLSELYNHVNQQPPKSDKPTVQATLSYLEACSNLFEKEFLTHDRVISLDSEVIKDSNSFQDGLICVITKNNGECSRNLV